jgi:hypothetical protein
MVVYADPYPQDTIITDEMFQYDIDSIIPKSTSLQHLLPTKKEKFTATSTSTGTTHVEEKVMITYSIIVLIIVVIILLLVLLMLEKK